MTSLRASTLALGLSILLIAAGCRDREITSYRAPKDPVVPEPPSTGMASSNNLPTGHPPIAPAGGEAPAGPMADTAVPTANGTDLTWTAPATWPAKALSAMRKGSYTVPGEGGEADLSVTAFPGATGGLEANLNRWRGQVGLEALPAADVAATTEKFTANGLDFIVVDYAGGGKRLIGAVVPFGGNSWFFKLMGPDALVEGRKAAFVEFLHTVKAP
jgi:hypothetical protein